MKALNIRYATFKDIADLVKLEETCFDTDRLSRKQFRHFITSATSLVMIAKHYNQLIAAAVILFRQNSKIARLYSLAVDPAFQKQGIAYTLHQFIEKKLVHHYAAIRLEVKKANLAALKFYFKNHYAIIGTYEKFYEDGEDAIRMEKKLHHMQLK